MKTLEFTVTDEMASKIEQAARDRGVSVEELLRSGILENLDREAEFASAATYVLSKNAELYKRLV